MQDRDTDDPFPRLTEALERIKFRVSHWATTLDRPLQTWRLHVSCAICDSIDWVSRVIWCHHNARVLVDTEDRLSCLLEHASGGMMSKPGYDVETMKTWVDTYIGENFQHNDDIEGEIQEAVTDALKPLVTLRPYTEYKDDLGPVLWWSAQRGKSIRPPRALFVGPKEGERFPIIAGMYFSLLPDDVKIDDPSVKPYIARWRKKPSYLGVGICEWKS